jgi:hypothetical protein
MTSQLTRLRRGLAAASVLALGTLALTSSAATASTGGAAELGLVPSEAITVQVLTANGSGCPAGTAAVRPQSDRTGFSVSYSAFTAAAGAGANATDMRKNCQLSLLVNVPQGFTFAIASADYSGYAHLAKGATGLHRTNYYFQGTADNSYSDHTFSGPLTSRWRTSDVETAPIYAPCGTSRVLNVNTELRIDDGSSTDASAMAMVASSGDVNSLFHFSWQRC